MYLYLLLKGYINSNLNQFDYIHNKNNKNLNMLIKLFLTKII